MKLSKEELKDRAWYRIFTGGIRFIISFFYSIFFTNYVGRKTISSFDMPKASFTCTNGAPDKLNQTYNIQDHGLHMYYDGTLSTDDLQ